ncbi:MAG: hypothetical protein R3Y63_06885 [Eubacteriales bacterium]
MATTPFIPMDIHCILIKGTIAYNRQPTGEADINLNQPKGTQLLL